MIPDSAARHLSARASLLSDSYWIKITGASGDSCARVGSVRTCKTCLQASGPENFYNKHTECKECSKKRRYRNRWKKWTGLDYDEIEAIRKRQKKVCACCGKKTTRLHVDHDHQTGKLRGLICASCNKGLGKFGDNIDGIKKALAYLLRAEEK